jgi:hypothetical protein
MILAQSTEKIGQIGGEGLGPFGKIGAMAGSTASLTGIVNGISSIIGLLTVIASIWFLFQILFAGYQWISAGGEPKKLQEARDRIVHAFIGMVIVVAAWSMLALVGQFFGFNSLIDPAEVIKQLSLPQ